MLKVKFQPLIFSNFTSLHVEGERIWKFKLLLLVPIRLLGDLYHSEKCQAGWNCLIFKSAVKLPFIAMAPVLSDAL